MSVSRRWTVDDLARLEVKETERYEIIDGELIVTHAPSWEHQFVAMQVSTAIQSWSQASGRGAALQVPGVVFSSEDAVIPDVVWASWGRLRASQDRAGHFTSAPELVVEILSPGAANERRDREAKLALYARRGVEEYWIVDPARRVVDIFRRVGGVLEAARAVGDGDDLASPLLLGFSLPVATIWPPVL